MKKARVESSAGRVWRSGHGDDDDDGDDDECGFQIPVICVRVFCLCDRHIWPFASTNQDSGQDRPPPDGRDRQRER
jgi:hypothetical protein